MTREQRKLRVAEQKALGVVEGDWIVFRSSGRAVRALRAHVDARSIDFLHWAKATAEEAATAEQAEHSREMRLRTLEAARRRPEYIAANTLASMDTEKWIKLPLGFLNEILQRLEAHNS